MKMQCYVMLLIVPSGTQVITVRLHVVLSRPCFLLPDGVLIMAVFAIRS